MDDPPNQGDPHQGINLKIDSGSPNENGVNQCLPENKERGGEAPQEQSWWRDLLCCQRKKTEESYVEPRGLLPVCMESVEELKKHYEEKHDIKKTSHLDIPEIHIGLPSGIGEDSSGAEVSKDLFSISQDSQYILVATSCREIKFFDSQTHKEVQSPLKFKNDISCFALSPDNKFLIVDFKEQSVEIFHFDNKKTRLYHNCGSLYCFLPTIMITEDSRYIISVTDPTSLKIFDIKERRTVNTFLNVHHKSISCITVTPDCKFIISASYEKSLKILDLATGREVYHFKEVHSGAITSVAVSPNNKFLLTASDDLSIRIFDLETKQQIYEFVDVHDGRITTLSISSDSRYVASGSADHSIKVFDLETSQLVSSLPKIHGEGIMKVAFAPNNKYLVSMSFFGSVKIINFETIMEKKQFQRRGELAAVISKENQQILVLKEFDGLHGIHMETGEEVFKIPADRKESIHSVAVSLDNNFLSYGTSKGSVEVIDWKTNQKSHSLNGIHGNAKITAVAITYDHKFIVSSSDNGLKVTNWETKKEHHSFPYLHQDPFQKITVIPKSQFIVLGSGDKSIKVLDIEKKMQVYNFNNAHRRPITCIAVTCDGKFLVSGSEDRSIKIFDLKTKQLVHWFQNAHNNRIDSLAVSTYNDCSIIVSGSRDGSIKVFDLQTRQQVHYFQEFHIGTIKSIAITSDNKYAITNGGGIDSYIKFLKLTPLSLLPNQNKGFINSIGSSELDALKGEISYVYSGFSHYCIFNGVDDFLFDTNMSIQSICDIAMRCSNLTVYPYRWNILHLVAVRAHYAFIKNMPEYAHFKVPFLLDTFSTTPLHYLIARTQRNFTCVNIMLNYICDYLDDLSEDQCYQTQEIIISLAPLFWDILAKTGVKIRVRFFNLCSKALPLPFNVELPVFGKTKTDVVHFCPTLESIYNSFQSIWKDGEDQIHFRSNLINLNYNVLSNDMGKTMKYLLEQQDEDIFQATFIIDLIDFLWNQTKWLLRFKFFVFSVYIIALSLYLSLEDRTLPFEIIILCYSVFSFLVQVLQIRFLHRKLLQDGQSYINICFHLLIIAYVIARISTLEDEFTRAWISSIVLLFGYFRWISFLRVWESTRSLIQATLTVVQNVGSFTVIIASIIVCFSFIFLVFNRGHLYGFYLNQAYHSLFGPVDIEEPSPSEILFIDLAAFLLFVILLNLLIAVMVDSYNQVLKERVKTDSKTRLFMIQEAVPILKSLRSLKLYKCLLPFRCIQPNGDLNRGFLVRYKSFSGKEDALEGRISPFREVLKQNENSIEKEIQKSLQTLQQHLARIDQKRKTDEERIEEKIIASENRVQAELEKTRKQMFVLLQTRQPNNIQRTRRRSI